MLHLILLLLFGGTLQLPAQELISLTVSQGAVSYQLEIGFHPAAGDTFDPGLDFLAPPPPPAFFAFLQWMDVTYFRDLRSHVSSPDTFRIRYLRNGNDPVILAWDPAVLPANREFIISDDFDLNGFRLDMKTTEQLVTDDHSLLFDRLRIVATRDPLRVNNHPASFPLMPELAQNSPNPWNPETWIRYRLPTAEKVNLSIYNLLGQLVITLVDQNLPPGTHAVSWDGKDQFGDAVAGGIYLYRLQAGDFVSAKKMILLR